MTGVSPTGVSATELAGEARDPRRDGRIFVINAVIEGLPRDDTLRGEGGGVGISVGMGDFSVGVAAFVMIMSFKSLSFAVDGSGLLRGRGGELAVIIGL